jgi:hypothetical protein
MKAGTGTDRQQFWFRRNLMSETPEDLTVDDKLLILKSTWPSECRLVGDHYLRVLASQEYEITEPEGGQNFDLKVLFDFISAGLRVINGVADSLKHSVKKKEALDVYDVIRKLDQGGVKYAEIQTDSLRVVIRHIQDALLSKQAGRTEGESD